MIRYFKLSRLLSDPHEMVHHATSTEARLLTRDGGGGGGGGRRAGRKSDGSTADTARRRKRPERPRTAARTNVLGKLHCAVEEQPEAKEVQLSQPSSTSLLMISSGLTVEGPAPLLLISPGTLVLHALSLSLFV